jgi:hypothetical protein
MSSEPEDDTEDGRPLTDADAKEAQEERMQAMISSLLSENRHLRDRVRELEREL